MCKFQSFFYLSDLIFKLDLGYIRPETNSIFALNSSIRGIINTPHDGSIVTRIPIQVHH